MTPPPPEWSAVKDAVAGLHAFLASAPTLATEVRHKELLRHLSILDVACLSLPSVSPEFLDAHELAGRNFRPVVEASFPDFGYYNFVRPVAPGVEDDDRPVVKDAVDDLEEILSDLDRALQLEAIEGWERAVWEVQESYGIHFGAHLADLRGYLYRTCFLGY
jgi:hypothetical protein